MAHQKIYCLSLFPRPITPSRPLNFGRVHSGTLRPDSRRCSALPLTPGPSISRPWFLETALRTRRAAVWSCVAAINAVKSLSQATTAVRPTRQRLNAAGVSCCTIEVPLRHLLRRDLHAGARGRAHIGGHRNEERGVYASQRCEDGIAEYAQVVVHARTGHARMEHHGLWRGRGWGGRSKSE
ncbi:hypothetical protein B0H14DRAFT_1639141 [Mycena olivaceomarginata]|nr:hypothetical protein B0H14DRAFT_1639141 [Mycena olivaceomarginata]